MSSEQPNILMIMSDQQSADSMSCAGNTDLSTPALDSLAARGTRFTRAYCSSPLCMPSRTSMVTAMLPSQLGVDDNISGPTAPLHRRSMGQVLADAGYDTAYAGKWHVAGIDHGRTQPEGSDRPVSGFTEIHRPPHDGLAEACVDYLQADERGERPFFLVASFVEPHGICEWARGQAGPSGEVEDPDWRELPLLPKNFRPGTEEAVAPRLFQQHAGGVHPTRGWTEEDWRRYRYAYNRLCERVDHEIGKVLAGLEASGHRDNTVVVFLSDHGDMQGAHGWNQKKHLYEESAGVPFIIAPPAGVDARETRSELVSTCLDLLPTLCDYAGADPEPDWAGRSVRPLVEGGQPEWRDSVVSETEWALPGLVPGSLSKLTARMMRTDRYKYVCYAWGKHREQLYDLEVDPGESRNLATSGAHQEILADMRIRLRTHCESVDDRFVRVIPGDGVQPR